MKVEERADTGLYADIIRSLLYYDVFDYPLTLKELQNNCKLSIKDLNGNFELGLQQLVQREWVYQLGEFYSVRNEPELAERRREGNQRAQEYLKIAEERSRLIMSFPFVNAVYLSGSISKNFMPEDGDIDYFIITEPQRLWVARTLLILFKKVFLLNSRKYFCLNYFIDTRNLEIEEQNLFTATELLTLIPMCDAGCYQPFIEANDWAKQVFPNFPNQKVRENLTRKKPLWSRLISGLLKGSIGDWIDHRFMHLTMNRWKRKFGHFNPADFEVAMKSRTYVSKHHPRNFQKKVMDAFEEKQTAFEKSNHISLREI